MVMGLGVNPREMDDLSSKLGQEMWHCLVKMLVPKPLQLLGPLQLSNKRVFHEARHSETWRALVGQLLEK
jgi:hypothetical protein